MLQLLGEAVGIMTLETALLSGLSGVTGGLVWAVTKLYDRLLVAETEVRECRDEIEELKEAKGKADAKVQIYENCPRKHVNECPFAHGELKH